MALYFFDALFRQVISLLLQKISTSSRRYRTLSALLRKKAVELSSVADIDRRSGDSRLDGLAVTRDVRVSVIVSTCNRADLLERALTGIAALRHRPIELVVVNGPSTDHTKDVLARWASQIKTADCPQLNLSASRNIGIALASGDVLAFIDDDAVPEPDWIERHLETMIAAEAVATGGVIRNRDGVTFQSRRLVADSLGNIRVTLDRASDEREGSDWRLTLTGTNFMVTRRALLAVGGFDERFRYYLEETDVQRRIVACGGKLAFGSTAEVHHYSAQNRTRDQHGTRNDYAILIKSLFYFGLRHAAITRGRNAVVDRVAKELQRVERRLREARRIGALDAAGARAIWRLSLCAVREFGADVMAPRLAFFDDPPPAFKSLLKRPRTRSARVAIVDDRTPAIHADEVESLARDLASQGLEVTLVSAPAPFASVQFHEGVWRHQPCSRTFLTWFSRNPARARSAAELRRVAPRRVFDWVLTAVDGAQKIDFFVAPYNRNYGRRGTPLGDAARLLNRNIDPLVCADHFGPLTPVGSSHGDHTAAPRRR